MESRLQFQDALSDKETAMLFIDDLTVSRVLTFPSLVEVLQAAHRRAQFHTEDVKMLIGEAHYFTRHATDPGRYICSKLVTSFPSNHNGALPTIQAVCVLFDGRNGTPLAVIDGTAVTYWKTAATSALGSMLLSRQDARILLVVGAGALADWLVRAHTAVRPSIERVLIWNRSVARANDLANRLRDEGLSAVPISDLDGAVSQADIISCCTSSKEALVKGTLLRPGVHLDLVGSHASDMREADDEAARSSRIFVDQRESALQVGDLLCPIRSGTISEKDVLGDLYDLASGMNGRNSNDDRTFFKNAGGGHLDLLTCVAIYETVATGE